MRPEWPDARRRPPERSAPGRREGGACLRKKYITPDEIMAKLREHGIDKLEAVKAATMESDGEITVIPHKGQPQDGPSRAKGVPPG